MDRDIHVLGLSSGELRPDNQILVILDHIDRRGPPGGLCPLLVPRPPGYAAEHLVQQAVHLAQRVVEPAAPVSAHHGLYPLLSLSPRIPRRKTSIPSFTVFAGLYQTSFCTRSLQAPPNVIRHAGACASRTRYAVGRRVPAATPRRRARRLRSATPERADLRVLVSLPGVPRIAQIVLRSAQAPTPPLSPA